jgi:hypothetical protein
MMRAQRPRQVLVRRAQICLLLLNTHVDALYDSAALSEIGLLAAVPLSTQKMALGELVSALAI